MAQTFDRSSHWLISHHGDSILRLAGTSGIRSWRPRAANVVQPRRLPDGLLEVLHEGETDGDLYLVEVSTYPERRAEDQMVDDAMLVYLDQKKLPELLTVVLCPRGNLQVTGRKVLASPRGPSRLEVQWRVVELWNVPAASLLTMQDVGLIPWVPLTHIDGSLEAVLKECRERIDTQASADEKANMLAVTQVLMRLRYNDSRLFDFFGGERAMIESPLITELMSKRCQRDILRMLAARFGPVPGDIAELLHKVFDEEKPDRLVDWGAICPDLDAFRARLNS